VGGNGCFYIYTGEVGRSFELSIVAESVVFCVFCFSGVAGFFTFISHFSFLTAPGLRSFLTSTYISFSLLFSLLYVSPILPIWLHLGLSSVNYLILFFPFRSLCIYICLTTYCLPRLYHDSNIRTSIYIAISISHSSRSKLPCARDSQIIAWGDPPCSPLSTSASHPTCYEYAVQRMAAIHLSIISRN
jgi:hypothetical protein